MQYEQYAKKTYRILTSNLKLWSYSVSQPDV